MSGSTPLEAVVIGDGSGGAQIHSNANSVKRNSTLEIRDKKGLTCAWDHADLIELSYIEYR